MTTVQFILESLQDTISFGIALGQNALPGDVVCLDGDLGAGKTTLTQSIAKGLHVPGDCYVTSPSFAILHEYQGDLPLYHMDFYRLQDSLEIEDLGLNEYFYRSGICVIEWSMRAEDILPEGRLNLTIKVVSPDKRKVSCSFVEQMWQKRLDTILSGAGLCAS